MTIYTRGWWEEKNTFTLTGFKAVIISSNVFMCPTPFKCVTVALGNSVSVTWGTHSKWGCDKSDEKLWDTCHNRAAPLRSDTQHTSPRWDPPLVLLSFQRPAAPQTEDSALSQLWPPIQALAPGQAPWAAAEALTGSRCCCLAGWSLQWTAPVALKTKNVQGNMTHTPRFTCNDRVSPTYSILQQCFEVILLQNELHPRPPVHLWWR